jgi:hypothetical protein
MPRTAAPPPQTATRRLTIVQALRDENLFGAHPTFEDLEPWSRWIVFLKALYGLPLEGEDLDIFRHHTGRTVYAPPEGGYHEAACIVGRQSGKSRIATLIASFEAALSDPPRDRTRLYALLVAQDMRGSLRTLFDYSVSYFEEIPLLKQNVVDRKGDTIALQNRLSLAAYPCRPEGVRGLRCKVAICDELAFFKSTENRPVDREMLRALRPSLATTDGRLIVLSSPYGQSGALWEIHRKHHGNDDSRTLVWQASASEMNPTLPADYLDRMKEEDPEAYRSEVLGEFREGVASFIEEEALEACVAHGRPRELPPAAGISYQAFVDPSGGSKDAFTVSVGHKDGECVVVDLVRGWKPPFNPTGVVEEITALIKGYGISQVTGDRYAGEWPREAFRSCGIAYKLSELDRSRLYLEMLPQLNRGAIELPHDKALLRELRGLERRRGPSGRDRVDHPPGSHDDLANAVAGCSYLCAPRTCNAWVL